MKYEVFVQIDSVNTIDNFGSLISTRSQTGGNNIGFTIFLHDASDQLYYQLIPLPRQSVRKMSLSLRPPRGVCEAHLHQAYIPCVIGAI